MLSFRQKIVVSYIVIFLVFVVFLYPMLTTLVDKIHAHHLTKQVERVIGEIEQADSLEQLHQLLAEKKKYVFFRITLFDPSEDYIFDSHLNVDDPRYALGDHSSLQEISRAMTKGNGYAVRYSSLFSQQMVYVAKAFEFKGKFYILRAAFPNGQIVHLTHDMTYASMFFIIVLLLLFSFLAWFIIHRLTKPVVQILDAIRPFQEGKQQALPHIKLENPVSEFGQLAATLNALSLRVESQIERLVQQRQEKESILD